MKLNIVKLFSAVTTVAVLTANLSLAQEVPSRSATATKSIVKAVPQSKWNSGDEPITLQANLNKSTPVNIPSFINEVHFGQPGIAELVRLPKRNTVTGNNAYIIGRTIGSTFMFITNSRGDVVFEANIEVGMDGNGIKSALRDMMPDENIDVVVHRNKVFLKGYVRSAVASAKAVDIAKGFVTNPADITNSIEILGSQQVIMKVRIAEIKRTALKQLGVNVGVDLLGGAGSRGVSFTTAGRGGITDAIITGGLINTGMSALGPVTFDVLETQGLAKTLAEPTLTALSGEAASFLAGGSVPVPTVDSDGNISTTMLPYGIGLDFTPTVLDKGRIHLVVSTKVSDLDWANKVKEVPGLTEKITSTTVDLPSGGTLFISGLIKNNVSNGVNGVPGLKDLPILGALFRSEKFTNEETELVITMTAYLAKSVGNASRLALPTDGFAPASDIDFYLLGRLHKTYTKRELPPYATPLAGPYGYIME